jgi:hypothetical protein
MFKASLGYTVSTSYIRRHGLKKNGWGRRKAREQVRGGEGKRKRDTESIERKREKEERKEGQNERRRKGGKKSLECEHRKVKRYGKDTIG